MVKIVVFSRGNKTTPYPGVSNRFIRPICLMKHIPPRYPAGPDYRGTSNRLMRLPVTPAGRSILAMSCNDWVISSSIV